MRYKADFKAMPAKLEAIPQRVEDSPCLVCGAYDYHDEGCAVTEN